VEPPEIPGRLRGLVAPHIDIRFSTQEYALAYAVLRGQPAPQRVVVFGTAHQSPENLFVLTRKAYGTPLGPIPADDSFIAFLERRFGRSLYADEWAHRTEHSIEFQAVFLRHIFPTEPGLKIVPILCSSFQAWVHNGHLPGDDARVRAFLDALREAEAELGPSVYVAAADLAHVGPKFGDRSAVDARHLQLLESQDRRMLASVENVDADGFFRNIHEEGDRRRICGLSPIYAMLKVLDDGEGAHKAKLLRYGQAPEAATGSVVTFASAAIYREG
jgi:AmmeMemoRadiSam system protein B